MVQNWWVAVVVGAKTLAVKNFDRLLTQAEIGKKLSRFSLSLSPDELWEESLMPSYGNLVGGDK